MSWGTFKKSAMLHHWGAPRSSVGLQAVAACRAVRSLKSSAQEAHCDCFAAYRTCLCARTWLCNPCWQLMRA